jgi:hypothetical protein
MFVAAVDRSFGDVADAADVRLVVNHARLERCGLFSQQGMVR